MRTGSRRRTCRSASTPGSSSPQRRPSSSAHVGLEEELGRATGGFVEVFSTEVDERTLAALVLYGRSDASKVRALLWDRNLSELKLPADIEGLPLRQALDEITHQSERLPEELRALDAELELLASRWRPWLDAVHEALAGRLQQIGTRASFFRTRYSFVISGWIPCESLLALSRQIAEVSAGKMLLEEVPVPAEEERQVPVCLANRAFIRP